MTPGTPPGDGGARRSPLDRAADRAAAERARRRRSGTPLLDDPGLGLRVERYGEEAGLEVVERLGGPPRLTVVRDADPTDPADPAGPAGPVDPTDPAVAKDPADPAVQQAVPEPVTSPADPVPDAPQEPDTLDLTGVGELLVDAVELVRRRLEGDYAVDEFGFDPELTERVLLAVLRPLYRHWFRVEVRGAHHIPADRGALLVGNHSGTLAWDALMTQVAVHEATGDRFLRMLGADLVFATPVVGDVARRMGATLAASSDAERLLTAGQLVGVWPEGFKGVGKLYRDRYRLQRFGRGGFVSAAIRTQVPIVPVSIVGAEEVHPMLADVRPLARLFGTPFWPVTPTWPWLGPLGLVPLPSKWLIEFGEPVPTDELDPGAADDPMVVFEITDRVREVVQQTLYALLVQRRSVFLG
ncbi:lysophospholipid acyltransferase family protein [Aquipuribacter sp. SD81]|uniref:lysophospholipid acyltransferase family protein n=1 Tax=Aquipuribacter sp. SD81 TaxID=3127703 RepID=UPI003018D873